MTELNLIISAVIGGGTSISVAILYARRLGRKDAERLQSEIDDCRTQIVNTKHFRLPQCDDDKKNFEKEQSGISQQISAMKADNSRVEKLIIQAIGEEITDRRLNNAEHSEFRGIIETVACETEKAKNRLEKAESKITDNRFSSQQETAENTRDIAALESVWREQKEDLKSIKGMVTDIFNRFSSRKR